ncbi:MAG: Mur ligase domain-containing protein, partial [Chloroflexota bacterium]
MSDTSIARLLAQAEPDAPAPLRGLIERLGAGGTALGARRDGQAIGPAGLADIAVRGVTHDSREVRPGTLFVAVPGLHVDGHEFVEAAAQAGAAAALVEAATPELPLPQLVVPD